ncbi:MAG TPA: DNA gyrase modulator, partial [Candidatus Fermentibacter sp.]|nr:DNA gyrase modulator [Candidatus Fermentibacter sp.]
MEKLLRMAMDAADQAEVFYREHSSTSLSMRNGSVTELSTSINSGYSLRIIRDGILGTAYTQNLTDRHDLLSNAVASMEGGVEAGYRFPGPHEPVGLDTIHSSIAGLGYSDIVDACRGALDGLSGRVGGQVDSSGGFVKSTTRIINSDSLDVSSSSGGFYVGAQVLFPATETSLGQFRYSLDKCEIAPESLDELVEFYARGLEEVDAPTGRMKVLFHPQA